LTWSVREVLTRFPQLRLDPEYQREGNIWSLSRRQLFLDSILNGFDSPKIYLHELVPPEFADESVQRYAVIDGRQRLEALRAFAEGAFPLGRDFHLLGDQEEGIEDSDALGTIGGRFAQLTLPGLRESNQVLARRFFAYPLTIVAVTTSDTSYIEELFFRLNEGSPLTAAEKRNRGELLRNAVNTIKRHPSFELFRVSDRRGRRNDLAVRFLFFEESNATTKHVPDMRAKALDDFAASFRPAVGEPFDRASRQNAEARLERLTSSALRVLESFRNVFQPNDYLLRLTGDILTFYIVFRSNTRVSEDSGLRGAFAEFFIRASALEGLDEERLSSDELNVLDYFGAIQGTTTGSYLAARATLVQDFALGNLNLRPAQSESNGGNNLAADEGR
jgi:hypothetical protein